MRHQLSLGTEEAKEILKGSDLIRLASMSAMDSKIAKEMIVGS